MGRGATFHAVKDRVRDAVKEHGELNATQLNDMVRGKKQDVLHAAKELAEDITEAVWNRPGNRRNEVIYFYDESRLSDFVRRTMGSAS